MGPGVDTQLARRWPCGLQLSAMRTGLIGCDIRRPVWASLRWVSREEAGLGCAVAGVVGHARQQKRKRPVEAVGERKA